MHLYAARAARVRWPQVRGADAALERNDAALETRLLRETTRLLRETTRLLRRGS
jgi:hypothetical protein